MEKIKKSLISRVSAIVLALALVIGTIPTSFINAQAAADTEGTVEIIDGVGGLVDSTDATNIIVKYEGEGVSIKHLENDDTVSRTNSGWFVGAIMNAPEGMTDFTNSVYIDADGNNITFENVTSIEPIYMWKQIDETEFETAKAAGTDLEYKWEFDWDTTTDGTQKVVFTIDTATVTLSDEDTVKPVVETIAANPSEWTNGAVVVSGTVSDNFSGVKTVSYKQEGTVEAKEATLTGNSFSFTVDATVYEGKYIVWCTDNKENVSENAEVSVYMDNVAPTVTAEVNIIDWTNESVTISGTVEDADSGVKEIYYQKTGETKVKLEEFDATDGTYSITIPAQAYAGDYTIYCIDNAGNEASAVVSVKMDNNVPELTEVKADVEDWTNGSIVISGKVSDLLSGVASVTWEKEDDQTTGSATYNASDNTFTFEVGAQEYEGNYIITSTDNAGNTTAGNTVSVKMDNGVCVVATGAADKPDWTNESVTISGTVKDELSGIASVSWKMATGTELGYATFDEDKNEYTFEVGAQDYEGNYIITCTDKAGNVSAEFPVAVKMDNTQPSVESAEANMTDWTNESVVISGTVKDELSGVASVAWERADGEASGNATYNEVDNTFTFTVDAQDYEGQYIITCRDKAGNVSDKQTVAVKMDNISPEFTVEVSTTDWTNEPIYIMGEFDENRSGIASLSYGKLGAEPYVLEMTGATTYGLTLGADDYNGKYYAYCTDAAGNNSDVIEFEVKMDKTAPTVESAEASTLAWTNKSVTISGTVNDLLSGVDKVTWVKEGDQTTGTANFDVANNKFNFEVPAQDYAGNYIITCTDKAGNVSAEVPVAVQMDKTVPAVTKAEADVTVWTNSQVVISGTTEDNLSEVVSVTYKKTGDAEGKTAVYDADKNEYSIVLAADDYEGTYTIYCTDAAGNQSADATVAVKMDKTASALSNVKADITDWTNGKVVISGNYDDNLSGVQVITVVKADDKTTQTATMNEGDKTFSFEIPAQNYEGDYTITCTDAAHNTSLEATVSVKMDNEQCKVVTGVAESADWTNKNVVISGTVSDNLSGVNKVNWVKADDAAKKGEATFDAAKKEYTFDVPAQDYAGNYIITCTDKAGNVSVEFPVEVKMDITSPVVEDAKASITKWTNESIVISGTVSDNLSGVETVTWVKEGDQTTGTAIFNADDNKFSFDVPAQDYEGKYIITCTDKASNVSAKVTVKVQMDITNPVVESAKASITDWTNKDVVISGTVSDNLAGVGTVTCIKESDNSDLSVVYNEEDGTFTIDVPAQDYEGNYIITCTDKAGNVSAEVTVKVQMDITNPVVESAVASITDWTKESLVISGKVSDKLSGISKIYYKQGKNGEKIEVTPNVTEEGIKFEFEVPAQSYEGDFIVWCVDNASNTSKEENVAVKMDNAQPHNLELKLGKKAWEEIVDGITFGLFYNSEQTMVVDSKDDLSGIKTIEYIEKNVKIGDVITREVLDNEDWSKNAPLYTAESDHEIEKTGVQGKVPATPNRNIIYCVRVIDYAGNVSYVTSNGLIFDTTAPAPALTDNKLVLPETDAEAKVPVSGRPLFNTTTVPFDVKVTEETIVGVLQSGIKSVTYEIVAKDRANDDAYAATENGTLYAWTEGTELSTEYTGKITVDSAKFNYNYVDLTVTVVDNAGNETTETFKFAIDITAPEVAISYNSIVPVDADDDLGYYNYQRIATITYTERSENWDAVAAEKRVFDDAEKLIGRKMIQAQDIKENDIKISESDEDTNPYTIKWETVPGEKSDEDIHIATVSFNPTNILELETEVEEDVDTPTEDEVTGDETVDNEESEDTIQPVEPVTGKDARYALDLSYTDAAGNSIATKEDGELDVTVAEGTVHPFKFVIDTVSPEVISIDYKEKIKDALINNLTFNYFGANAEVTVTLKDETAGINEFDYEGLLDSDISDKNKAVILTAVENADIKQQTETDKSEFVVQFTIPKEALTELNSFRGTVRVNAWDYCDNTVQKHDETHLVVDKIAPTCQVTFDQPVNEVEGVSYYDKSFTATIVIDEANFYKEDVEISINGTRVMPTDWTQTPGTDIWTSHVSFIEENDYILTVNYTDRSGNVMTTYESNQRTLDTTEPVISVSNIKHESANNEETIGFVLTVTDKNMALANVKPQATAVIREGDSSANYTYKTVNIDLGTPTVTTNAKGETVYTYTVTNLEIDGYYSLVCTVVDHANHSVSNIGSQSEDNRGVAVETVNFSVNRGGSVFWIETIHNDKYSDTTFNNELNGAYANDEVTVKLHEVNVDRVDELDADDKRTVLTLNDGNDSNTIELVENNNGNGNYDRNVRIGEGGWYETIYTLENDQFAKDGTYSLNIITYDKAENSNVNTKNEEGTIQFVVDRTNPVITTNVKSKQIIDANEYTVELTIAEVNLDESTLVVKLEGNEVEWTKVSNNTYQFTLDEAQWANFPNLSQDFEITAKDLAGNSAEVYQREDITVTDDVIIQVAAYMINRPLLLGLTGAGVVAIAGLTIFSVVWKKRKKYEA